LRAEGPADRILGVMSWDAPWAEADSPAALAARFRRISVPLDPELAAALALAGRVFPGASAACVIRELALKGAGALAGELFCPRDS
jgi:hypothetical protein